MTLQTRLNLGILGIAIVLVAPLVISLQSLQKLQEGTSALLDSEKNRRASGAQLGAYAQ